MKKIVIFLIALTSCILEGCATQVTDLSQGNTGLISYPSSVKNINLQGELVLPGHTTGRVPVMILVHGSGGRSFNSYRENLWGTLFRSHGIATFSIDYFTPRGIDFKSSNLPAPPTDIYDAVNILATHPRIDSERIGVIGYSRGGHLAAITSNNRGSFTNGIKTSVHVALYPICKYLNDIKTGPDYPPLLILIGTQDSYGAAEDCIELAIEKSSDGRQVKTIVYEGAYHGWDGNYNGTVDQRVRDSKATIRSNESITRRSMDDVVNFIKGPMRLEE